MRSGCFLARIKKGSEKALPLDLFCHFGRGPVLGGDPAEHSHNLSSGLFLNRALGFNRKLRK